MVDVERSCASTFYPLADGFLFNNDPLCSGHAILIELADTLPWQSEIKKLHRRLPLGSEGDRLPSERNVHAAERPETSGHQWFVGTVEDGRRVDCMPLDLLWMSPEHVRTTVIKNDVATVMTSSLAGDVYSFGIIMQEVILRGAPYCMLDLSPQGLTLVTWVCLNASRPLSFQRSLRRSRNHRRCYDRPCRNKSHHRSTSIL